MPFPMASLPGLLPGTLSLGPFGDVVRTTGEAEEAMRQLLLKQVANEAAASGAFQQYQGAAATPAPPLTPLDALPQLFSNFASIISQRPEFSQRRERSDAAMRAEALQRRADNIQALRDNYERMAQQAAKIDPVQAIKWQEKVAAQDRVLETMRENMKFAQAQEAEEKKLALQHKYKMTEIGVQKAETDKAENARKARLISSLGRDWAADKEVQGFATVRDAYTTGSDASARNNSAGDIILMRMIAKVTDPTTGVREEEFKTFERAQGTLARYGVQLTRQMWGKGTLNEFGREQMRGILDDIYNRKLEQYNRATAYHISRTEYLDIDPSLIMRDITPTEKKPASTDARSRQSLIDPFIIKGE